MADYLQPFSVAADIIQSERAGLLDVHLQFHVLDSHVRRVPDVFNVCARVMQKAIRNHWKKHVNQSAVFMVAKFSCENTDEFFCSIIRSNSMLPIGSLTGQRNSGTHSESLLHDGPDVRSEELKANQTFLPHSQPRSASNTIASSEVTFLLKRFAKSLFTADLPELSLIKRLHRSMSSRLGLPPQRAVNWQ